MKSMNMGTGSDKVKDSLGAVAQTAKPTPKYPKKGAGKALGWKNPNGKK